MKKIVLSFMLVLLMTCVACGPADSSSVVSEPLEVQEEALEVVDEKVSIYPFELVDSLGRTVTIEAEPNRIISVAPNITETICALGLEDKLVGRTNYCDYPASVTAIESIGLLSDPSIEAIVNLEPDLIVGSTHFETEVLENLESLGYTVVVLYGEESFEGVYETIDMLASILDVEDRSQELVEAMKTKVDNVLTALKDVEPKSVYYVVAYGESGDYTATGDTFISHILRMAGGDNVAQSGSNWRFSYEKLIESDPSIMICSDKKDAKAGLMSSENYQLLTAVSQGQVYEVNNNLLDRQGPRLADGLEAVARVLHPERFSDEKNN